ncbi:cupin domain-containing protein [Nisaea sp.]|uniref:cupin domain-containing protein n=1 Tax=Nisaea sp. TaxID=2024842 RepID=UPI00329769B3
MELFQKAYYPAPVDEAGVRKHWDGEGYSFHLMTDPMGQEWNDFVHAVDEYVTVAEGQLRISVGEETFVANPGDLVFIPRDVPHSLKTLSAAGSRWLFGYN